MSLPFSVEGVRLENKRDSNSAMHVYYLTYEILGKCEINHPRSETYTNRAHRGFASKGARMGLRKGTGVNPVKVNTLAKRLVNRAGKTVLEIVFPEGNEVRSRRIVTRSRARPTGKYPSWKMGRMIQWESQNELNAYRLLDATPAVQRFQEQPLMLRYVMEGECHIHYPDVYVEAAGGSRELWEIKPMAQARLPEFAARTRLLEASLPELGFSYRMVLAEDLAKQPRLNTVLELLKHGRVPVSVDNRERVRQLLNRAQALTWKHAEEGSLGPNGRETLARLALEGFLDVDMEQPFTRCTCFSMAAASIKGGA